MTMTEFIDYVHSFENFPKQGVIYWDTSPLLACPEVFDHAVEQLAAAASSMAADRVAAIEAKGFAFGAALAARLKLPLTLIRKSGLTPGPVRTCSFIKEYGEGTYELGLQAVPPGEKAVIVYDILACAGASLAAVQLLRESGADAAGFCYAVELEYLGGRQPLSSYPVFSLLKIRRRETARRICYA